MILKVGLLAITVNIYKKILFQVLPEEQGWHLHHEDGGCRV